MAARAVRPGSQIAFAALVALVASVGACGRGCAAEPEPPAAPTKSPDARPQALPEIEQVPVVIVVVAEAPGYAPDQVEAMVVVPLEAALLRVPGVEQIESSAAADRGTCTLSFASESDPFLAASAVREALQDVLTTLPEDINPTLQIASGVVPIAHLTLTGDLPATTLLDVATEVLRPALLTIPGVTDVQLCGGRERRVVVRADPRRLAALGVGEAAVIDALRSTLGTRLRPGPEVPTIESLGAVRVGNATLRDLADIVLDPVPPSCIATSATGELVLATVLARSGPSLRTTEAALQEHIARLTQELPTSVTLTVLPADPASLELALPPGAAPDAALDTLRSMAPEGSRWVASMDLIGTGTLLLWSDEALRGTPAWDGWARNALDAALHTPGVAVRRVEGAGSTLLLRIVGEDAAGVGQAARALASRPAPDGALAVVALGEGETRVVRVTPDRERLARLGITARAVREAAHPGGTYVGPMRVDGRDLAVTLETSAGLREALVRAPGGGLIPLTAVATIETTTERAALLRVDAQPAAIVAFHVGPGGDPAAVRAAVDASLKLPEGMEARWAGR